MGNTFEITFVQKKSTESWANLEFKCGIEIRYKFTSRFDFVIYCCFDYFALANIALGMFKGTEKLKKPLG